MYVRCVILLEEADNAKKMDNILRRDIFCVQRERKNTWNNSVSPSGEN